MRYNIYGKPFKREKRGRDMGRTIYKFERDMLRGSSIHVNKKLDGNWYQKHWHNYYELVYFSACSGSCILNGESYEIKDNCLFLLTPKDFHQIFTDEKSDGRYALIIGFNEHIADAPIRDMLTGGPFVYYDVPSETREKLGELYSVFLSKRQYRDAYVKHLFSCILLNVAEKASTVAQSAADINPIVRESIATMLSDPTKDLSLGLFSERYKVTSSYFSRLFHESVGISFKQYLTSLRLEYAKRLLEENELPIIDVGYECGFNTPSQFYRAFKAETSLPPSEYRRQKLK